MWTLDPQMLREVYLDDKPGPPGWKLCCGPAPHSRKHLQLKSYLRKLETRHGGMASAIKICWN